MTAKARHPHGAARADAVLAAVGRLGPFFAVGVGEGGRPVGELYGNVGGALDDLVARHAVRLRTGERRVAASILFQGYAARLWSPVLGCVGLGLPLLDLSAGRLRWREEPFGLSVIDPGITDAGPGEVVGEHLRPMVEALHECAGVAVNLLWGNASSALVGTLTVLRQESLNADRLRIDAVTTVVRELLLTEPLRGTGMLDGGSFRRRSCCLFYRVPGGGLCGDCCLTSVPTMDDHEG